MPGYGDAPPEHRWKPGQSGNPAGRKRGSINLTTLIRKKLRERDPETKMLWGEILAARLIEQAVAGDSRASATALREIMNRIDGPVTAHVDVTSAGQSIGDYRQLSGLTDDELRRLAGVGDGGADPASPSEQS